MDSTRCRQAAETPAKTVPGLIVYKPSDENGDILLTRPPTSSFFMAGFIALDHDDRAVPNALFGVQTIQNTGAVFVWRQEIKILSPFEGSWASLPQTPPVRFQTTCASSTSSRIWRSAARYERSRVYELRSLTVARDHDPNSPDRKSASHQAYQKVALHFGGHVQARPPQAWAEALRHLGGDAIDAQLERLRCRGAWRAARGAFGRDGRPSRNRAT